MVSSADVTPDQGFHLDSRLRNCLRHAFHLPNLPHRPLKQRYRCLLGRGAEYGKEE